MKMKIAFIGQKGIPAIWGGVETHVEELGSRLAVKGHKVTVYVRNWYTPKDINKYKGIELKHIPCIHSKYFDAAIHAFNSSINSLFNLYDIIHYQAMGPAIFSWIPRMFGKKVVATIHRFDYESGKWGCLARKALKISERLALSIPSKTIVVAKYLKEIYKNKGYNPVYIPNGVNIPDIKESDIIKKEYKLKGKDYILYMGRLVPEKRCDWLINAFKKINFSSNNNLKLVIAGGSSSSDDYVNKLKNMCNDNNRIIFTGYVTGLKKEELLSNALLFVLPSYLEGLPIAVLEASSYGLPCLASDIVPHKEVIVEGAGGFLFLNNNYSDLENKLKKVISFQMKKLERVGMVAKENVKKKYDWDSIVNKTEKLYFEVLKN
jgi:glycosyltransferase involved in cell wall biosynthesis